MTTTTTDRSTSGRTARPLRTATVLAGATLAPAAVWLLARATGTDLEVTLGGGSTMVIGLPAVLGTALTASLAGWGALAALRRLTRRARGAWTALALGVLAASFAPVATADTGTAARTYLALMHLTVAAVLVPGLRRAAGASRRRPS